MKIEGAKSSDGGKGESLVRFGYWIMIIMLVFIGSSLAYGAPAAIAEDLTIFPVFLVIFYWRYLGLGRHYKDERLAKMATRAMTASWTLSLLIASALTTLTAYSFLNLTALQVLGIIIAVMAFSMAAFNEYYKRKGDIDF